MSVRELPNVLDNSISVKIRINGELDYHGPVSHAPLERYTRTHVCKIYDQDPHLLVLAIEEDCE